MKNFLFGIFGVLAFVLLGMVFAQVFIEQRTEAQTSGISYSRYEDDPFEKYSFAETMRRVNAIKAEGHPVPVGHPRIFIHAANKEVLRQKIAANYTTWMLELVNLADANFGKVITDPGAYSNEPDAQPVILANALIYQLGLMPGITYQHTQQEYGLEGVRHLLGMAAIETTYLHVEYLGLPLGYDWLYELMTDGQRRTVAAKLLAYAQPLDSHVLGYNNPPGAELLGALAVRGDGIDDAEAQRLVDLFYNGYVFGDRTFPLEGSDYQFMSTLIFTPEGPGVEALVYSSWNNPFYPILLAWRDQTGEDYFKLPFFQNWPLHFTHLTGNEYERQDKYQERWKASWRQGSTNYGAVLAEMEMGLAASNPDAAALAKYHLGNALRFGYVNTSLRMLYMLQADPVLAAQSSAQLKLPKTAHFEGVNNVFSRSSWQGTDSTWLWFQGPTWNARDLGPLNDLVIWKNGGMLLGKHNQAHDYDGGNRTNTLVLYDENQPGKTFIPQNVMDKSINRQIGLQGSFSYTELNKNLIGYHEGLRYFEEKAGDYLYAFGDGGQEFQGTETSNGDIGGPLLNLPGWSRQLVHLPAGSSDAPDYFFVFDRVNTARDTIHPYVPLHFNTGLAILDRATNQDLGPGVVDNASNRFTRVMLGGTVFYSVVEYQQGLTLELVDPQSPNRPLSVSVAGQAVTVRLATDASGNIISTNADVVNLINTNSQTNNLIRAYGPVWPYGSQAAAPTNGPVPLAGDQGIWRYDGANRIVATNSVRTDWGQAHGRLFVDTLLPADPIYYRMGGLVERNIDRFGNLQLMGAGSEEDPQNILDGMWRVEIGSTEPSDKQIFLHVMQATDSTVNVPSQTILLEGQGIIGASVPGTVTLFSVSEGELVNGSLTTPSGISGTYRLLLADLSPETAYTIGIGGTTLSRTASKTGTIFLENISLSPGTTVTVQRSGSSDTQPPIISNVTVSNIINTAATIRWTTNERADTQVEYGRTATYGTLSSLHGSLVTQHSATLTGLSPQTLYHFRVRSKDAAGNLGTSPDGTFTTTASIGPPPPPPPPPPPGPEPIPPPPTPPKPPTEVPGLVGEWKFDETSGTVASDATVNGNHGTLKNDPQWVSGALRFDGIDDYVDLGTAVSQTGPMSVSAWVKASSFPSGGVSIAGNGSCNGCSNYSLGIADYYAGNTLMRQKVFFQGLAGGTTIAGNRWYFVVATRSGQSGNWNSTLYMNGSVDATGTSSATSYADNLPTFIGNFPTLASHFSGAIDDLCLWDRPLTATEVSTLFNRGSPGKTCDDLTAPPPPSAKTLLLIITSDYRDDKKLDQDFSKVRVKIIEESTGNVVLNKIYSSNNGGEIVVLEADLTNVKDDKTTEYKIITKIIGHVATSLNNKKDLFSDKNGFKFKKAFVGDFNEDGKVDRYDINILITYFKTKDGGIAKEIFKEKRPSLTWLIKTIFYSRNRIKDEE